MSNTTIAWTSTNPADSDLLSAGAGEIRSTRSNTQLGLSQEHFWPEGGGPAGAHRLGSARVYVGPSSQVSSGDTSGRMMFNSTLSQLVYLDSTSSTIVGGRLAIHGTGFGGGMLGSFKTQYLVLDSGVLSNVTGPGNLVVGGFNAAFVVAPNVTITVAHYEQASGNVYEVYAPVVTGISTSVFTVLTPGSKSGSASTMSIHWTAIGKVAYP